MYRPSVNLGIAFAVFLSAVAPVASPVFAQSDLAEEAKRKVNLAGRQRMLSQRMSKAACFMFTDVDAAGHQTMLAGAQNLFATTHDGLRFGNPELGLKEETKSVVNHALGFVDDEWVIYAPSVEEVIADGIADADQLQNLNAAGLTLLGVMNTAVGKTAAAYGEDLEDLPLILAITIDLAGRQRMFTQKLSKEFCLIDAGINVEENTARLSETLEYFNLTLNSLIGGFPGVVLAAPNDDILAKLEEVQSLWAEPSSILADVAAGKRITNASREIISKDIELVLSTMNEAVGLYEFVNRN